MGRERYANRQRFLYALIFSSRRCYIGQTCDPHRRFLEHQRAWRQPFESLVLGSIEGTFAHAEIYERAYRFLAYRSGWSILFDPKQPWATLKHPQAVRVKGLSLPRSMTGFPWGRLVFWLVVLGLAGLIIKSWWA